MGAGPAGSSPALGRLTLQLCAPLFCLRPRHRLPIHLIGPAPPSP